MTVLISPQNEELSGAALRRAIAISNIKWFRAIAWKALSDRSPNSELRAANARAAAWILLKQARRDALVYCITTDAMSGIVRPPSTHSRRLVPFSPG
jgi:hypothetical protein